MVFSKDIKISICFGLIVGVILSICNLCLASSEVSPVSVMNNTTINASGKITSISSTASVKIFTIEPGQYMIVNNYSSSNIPIGTTEEYPTIDMYVNNYYLIPGTESYTLFFNDTDNDKYLVLSSYGDFYKVYYDSSSLDNFVNDLTYSLSFSNLGEIVVFIVPILAIGVLFALGFYFLKNILNKTKRTKGGV